jgi:hypothetical protein
MLDQLPLPIEIYTLWGNLSIIEYGKKSFGSTRYLVDASQTFSLISLNKFGRLLAKLRPPLSNSNLLGGDADWKSV